MVFLKIARDPTGEIKAAVPSLWLRYSDRGQASFPGGKVGTLGGP